MTFASAFEDAITRLKAQEACPKHKWSRPKHATERRGMMRVPLYLTRCQLCGAYVTRATLAELKMALGSDNGA